MCDLEKQSIIDPSRLNRGEYFTSLLEEGLRAGVFSGEETAHIKLECLGLLAEHCRRFIGVESSSIRVEEAESLLQSLFYTVSIKLKALKTPDKAAELLKQGQIKTIYRQGRMLIDKKCRSLRSVYYLALKTKLDTENEAYTDTLCTGVPAFLSHYLPDVAAQDNIITMDYPLCSPVIGVTGVECLLEYTWRLYLENLFCAKFEPKRIKRVLSLCTPQDSGLIVNLFEPVLTQAVGCVMAGCPLYSLSVPYEKAAALQTRLAASTKEEQDKDITAAYRRLMGEFSSKAESLRDYLKKCFPQIRGNIDRARRTGSLAAVFRDLSGPAERKQGPLSFVPAPKMEDEAYRLLLCKIESCRTDLEKTALILGKVKSLDDLEDILLDAQLPPAVCTAVFRELGDMELAVLSRRLYERAGDAPGKVTDLHPALAAFIGALAPKRRRAVQELYNRL